MPAEEGGCILMQNTCSCENRQAGGGAGKQGGASPAIHKSPTVSQEGRVSNLFMCVSSERGRGRGGEANQPL